MPKIKSIDAGMIREIDVDLANIPIQIPNIYMTSFDSDNTLIVDSFYDIVDIIPNNLVNVDQKTTLICDRYSQTQTPDGLNNVKFKYESSLTKAIEQKNIVSFAICITYSCNMRCIYCFERDKIQRHRHMSFEELKNALHLIKIEIDKIRAEKPETVIYFELFGGEPLQIRDKHLVEYVLKFCREVGCFLTITSNGYEIVNFIDTFVKFRDVIAFVCVTLDGTEDIHNSRRIIKTGSGSFKEIVNGVQALLNLGFSVGVATNIDKDNIDCIADLLAYYDSNGWLKNERFMVEVGRVDDKYDSGNLSVLPEATILQKLLKIFPNGAPAWLNIAFLKSTERIASLLGVGLDQHEYGRALYHHCWATSPIVGGSYIGPDLDMFRCTVSVGNNDFLLGHLGKEDYLKCYDDWIIHTCFSRNECINCEIGGFCGGGCVIEKKIKGFNRICEYEKRNFDDFIDKIAIPKLNSLI